MLLGLALGPLGPAPADDAATVTWRKDAVSPEAWEAVLGLEPAAAARTWAPFAEEHGYRLFLTDDGRVLLLVPEKNKSARKELGLIEEACELFDALLPPPPDPPSAPAEPETPIAPQEPGAGVDEGGEEAWSTSWSWGDGPWQRDAETIVLVAARDRDDYAAAVDGLAEAHPYLRGWTETAKSYAGCTLQKPLAAAWLLADDELEEYEPRNELVHRLAELLVLRRFDRQPTWLLQGIAWHLEYEVTGSHYCFPWRAEFVYEAEHGAWGSALKSDHKRKDALAIEEVIGLTRGDFRADQARNAWGAAAFLLKHHPSRASALLEDLRRLQEERGIIHHDDGTWELVPDYQPSSGDTLTLLERHAGPDVLGELLTYFAKGKGYKPRR